MEKVIDTSPEGSPEAHLLQEEERERLKAACSKLPQRYRSVVDKFYFQDKGYQEIAAEEGISLKTVESRLYRARMLLRQNWEEAKR